MLRTEFRDYLRCRLAAAAVWREVPRKLPAVLGIAEETQDLDRELELAASSFDGPLEPEKLVGLGRG
jgi:hypothetical protein